MNILMAGLFTGNSFDGDEILANGFKALGHNVTKVNYRKTPFINFKLQNLCKKNDILIIGKGEGIWPITLKSIKIPKIFWYGDQRDDVQPWVVNRAKYCDLFLHTTSGDRLNDYAKVIKKPSAFFMVPCDPDLYNDSLDYCNDIFYSGSPLSKLGDNHRRTILNELSILKNFKWAGQTPDTVVKGKSYANAISQSKITISINHFNHFYKYNSDRIVHYSAGSFVLAYAVPGISDLFQAMPTFDSVSSLNDQIKYFLENNNERELLKDQIIHETRSKYNSLNMCKYILDLLLNGHSSVYNQFEIIK